MPKGLEGILAGSWEALQTMAPYLLLGFLLAGVISVLLPERAVGRLLGGRGFWPILKASLLGIPLPVCSCAVLPLAASLRVRGAGKGATASFLISTPQTGVDSILVTWSLLGPVFALFRPLAALASGLLGGLVVAGLRDEDEARPAAPPACSCCHGPAARRRPWPLRALEHGFLVLPRELGFHLLVGLALAGLIGALVPADFFADRLGRGLPAMLAMMALGLPVYICATASVPMAAALMAKGISPGAALVFLAVGPATNVAALATVWKLLGGRGALAYLAAVALTAMASGLFLDLLWPAMEPVWLEPAHVHEAGGGWFGPAAAVLLAAVLLRAVVGSRLAGRRRGIATGS